MDQERDSSKTKVLTPAVHFPYSIRRRSLTSPGVGDRRIRKVNVGRNISTPWDSQSHHLLSTASSKLLGTTVKEKGVTGSGGDQILEAFAALQSCPRMLSRLALPNQQPEPEGAPCLLSPSCQSRGRRAYVLATSVGPFRAPSLGLPHPLLPQRACRLLTAAPAALTSLGPGPQRDSRLPAPPPALHSMGVLGV